jgi:hypothetical protein
MWVGIQQRLCRKDHARSAEAALNGTRLVKGTLYRVQFPSVGEAFDSCNLMSVRIRCKRQTGKNRLTVKQHRAGAAVAKIASLFGPGQTESLPQGLKKRLLVSDANLDPVAVYSHSHDNHI